MALLVYTDPSNGRSGRLALDTESRPVVIGRHETSSLRFANGSVSRKHCEIRLAEGDWRIRDLGSSNGTKVNSKRITGLQRLLDGDQIDCGEITLRFYAKDAPAEADGAAGQASAAPGSPASAESNGASSQAPSRVVVGPAVAAKKPEGRGGESSSARAPERSGDLGKPGNSDSSGNVSKPARPEKADEARNQSAAKSQRKSKRDARTPTRAEEAPTPRSATTPPASRDKPEADGRAQVAAIDESKRMRVEFEELNRRLRSAESERDQLRDGFASKATTREREWLDRIRRAEAERDRALETLEQERSLNSDQAVRMKELDEKGVRYSMQLESVTEKYRQVREELDRLRSRLDQSREDTVDKDDRIDELERAKQVADEELGALRTSMGEHESRLREMKIRMTEKDRLLDQLHDQLAEMEYELSESRGQLKQLQTEFNRDGGALSRSEQKANVLREIIEDKENIIAALRRDLEEQDREIKQVRMGVGMADLEEERRKVLDDFYKKSREVDALTDEVSRYKREKEQLGSRIAELEGKADDADEDLLRQAETTRGLEQQLKDHRKELAALTREKVRLEEQVAEAQAEAAIRTSEELQRAQSEMTDLRLQVEQLQDKLAAAREAAAQQDQIESFRSELGERFEVLSESFVALRSQMNLLTAYVRDIREAATRVLLRLASMGDEELGESGGGPDPDAVETVRLELDGAVDSFAALVDVVVDEADRLQTDMANFRASLDTV